MGSAQKKRRPAPSKLVEEIRNDVSDLSLIWVLDSVDRGLLRGFERRSARDNTLAKFLEDMESRLQKARPSLDLPKICGFFDIYSEAVVYDLLLKSGLGVERIPEGKQPTPDFKVSLNDAAFFVEVKTLDIEDGPLGHQRVMNAALDGRIGQEERLRGGSGHAFAETEVPVKPSADTRAGLVSWLMRKGKASANSKQFKHGPTFLFLSLLRCPVIDAGRHSTNCAYFDQAERECASGELWYAAFGKCGDLVLDCPEFEGARAVSRVEEDGILSAFPELYGVGFVTPVSPFSKRKEIYLLARSTPVEKTVDEDTYLEVVNRVSDCHNDEDNSRALRRPRRPKPRSKARP